MNIGDGVMNSHLHEFNIESDMVNGHNHRILGFTESTVGFNLLHFHYFWGICSYRGHTHYFSGFTGLPVKTENGHIHRIEGLLEMNNLHEHRFTGYTREEVHYISKKVTGTALI